MISQLSGLILEKTPPTLVVDTGGLAYEVDLPLSSFAALPEIGERVRLYTHFVVREDAQLLFAFLDADTRAAFRQLLKVSGIGARMALAALSTFSVSDLSAAIESDDIRALSRIPGVGKKTAERMILDLRGKLSAAAPQAPLSAAKAHDDIAQALAALGYRDQEISKAMQSLPSAVATAEGLRLALKALAAK